MYPCGVGQLQYNPSQPDTFLHNISCGPCNIGDYGSFKAKKHIHQSRFAHIRLAGDTGVDAVFEYKSTVVIFKYPVKGSDTPVKAFFQSGLFHRRKILLRVVHPRRKLSENVHKLVRKSLYLFKKLSAACKVRRVKGVFPLCGNGVHYRFSLGQGHLSV